MKSNKGISLIVLVITIIIMIILAGAIVLTLNNTSMIDKAEYAVDANNEASVKTFAEMLWSEAYLNTDRTQEKLEKYVYDRLIAENLDLSEYGIAVTTKGVQVVKGWIQDGLYVRRGLNANGKYNENLEIGASIEYDPTANGTIDVVTEYSNEKIEWKILGANDKGELLIVSTIYIIGDSFSHLGDPNLRNFDDCKQDWLTVEAQLNYACEPYGKGKSATGARCMTVEDINKITGYNPSTAGYGNNEFWEYGNSVTYIFNGKGWNYTSTNGKNGIIKAYLSRTARHSLLRWKKYRCGKYRV